MINKILVPVDGSKIALRALDFAMELGSKFGSQIIVINIDVPYDLSRIKPPRKDKNGNIIPLEAAAPTPLEEAEREAKKVSYSTITFKKVVDIDPAERICGEAEKDDVDMIIMATGVWVYWPGSSWAVSVPRYPRALIAR